MGERGQCTVLLTGATGYVGGRLLRHLEARDGLRVRCLTRHPDALAGRTAAETEVVAGDVLDARSLAPAMHGVHTAYYLIHSMRTSRNFDALDRAAAENFAAAARAAGVMRIIYLGGLGDGGDLSSHLASRQEVGDVLRASGVPTVEFRASIVIGPGSASYETVRALAERLPVMFAPRSINTAAQPIAIEDLIEYLLAALHLDAGAIFEIGGQDRVSYAEIIREYARQRRLRRPLVAVPVLSPVAAHLFLSVLAPAHGLVAAAMFDSLRNETVVNSPAARDTFSITPRDLSDAIARALVDEDRQFAQTEWSEAFAPGQRLDWSGLVLGRRLVSSRALHVRLPPGYAFDAIRRIGGHTGWYATEWFWRARGLLDTIRGGVGLRRGRRDQFAIAEAARHAAVRQRRRRLALLTVLAALLVVAAAIAAQSGGRRATAANGSQVRGAADSHALLAGIPQHGLVLGSPSAPVRLVEFADLQCPYCDEFATQALPSLVTHYVRTGRVSIEFRNLSFIGPDSVRAGR